MYIGCIHAQCPTQAKCHAAWRCLQPMILALNSPDNENWLERKWCEALSAQNSALDSESSKE
jgi:hypothetical protein